MTTVIQSSTVTSFGTEDAMEMSSDPTWRAHESDEIEIDSNFGETHDSVADEEMVPADDDENLLMPLDITHRDRQDLDPSDAPMDDQAVDLHQSIVPLEENEHFDLAEINGGRHKDDNSIEEDLLDETDEVISNAEQPSIMDSEAIEHQDYLEPQRKPIDPSNSDISALPTDLPKYQEQVEAVLVDGSQTKQDPDSVHTGAEMLDKNAESRQLDETLATEQTPIYDDSSYKGKSQMLIAPLEPLVGSEPNFASTDDKKTNLPDQVTTKEGQNESSLEKGLQSSVLHPVYVVYQEEEIPLFPMIQEGSEGSEISLLKNESLASIGMLEFLNACREVIQDDVDENEELEIAIEDLDLKVCESNLAFSGISFARILELFVDLHRNEGTSDPPPLYAYLYTVTNYSRWFNYLSKLEADGIGMSAIMSNETNEETSPININVSSDAETSNIGQEAASATLSAKDDQTSQLRSQDNVKPNSSHDHSGHALEFEEEAEHLNSSDSYPHMGPNENNDSEFPAPSSKAARKADNQQQGEEPVNLAGEGLHTKVTGVDFESDQHRPTEDVFDEPPEEEVSGEIVGHEEGIGPANEDYLARDVGEQAEPEEVQAQNLTRNGIETTTLGQGEDSHASQIAASGAKSDITDHFGAEDQFQDDYDDAEAEAGSQPNSVGSGKGFNQHFSGSEEEFFKDNEDTHVDHTLGSGSEERNVDNILTDEELDGYDNIDRNDEQIVSNAIDSGPVLEGNEIHLDDEGWDLRNEIEAAPVLTSSPGSLKRTRPLGEEEDIDGKREDNAKRSRAS